MATPEPGPKPQYRFAAALRRPAEDKSAVYAVEFFPSEEVRIFANCGGRRATIVELVPGTSSQKTKVRLVRGFIDEDTKEDYYCCTWTVESASSGRPWLCVGGEAGIIKILDIGSSALLSYLSGHGGPIYDLKVHPGDCDLIFSCSKDESIRLWSLKARRCLVIFAGDQGHRDAVLGVDVHASGKWLATSGMDNTVKVWELDADIVKEAIHKGRHSADLNTSSSSSSAGAVERFKAPFIQFPAFTTRRVHTDYVDCIRWVGDLLMTKSIESKCVLWKPDTRQRVNSVSPLRTYSYTAGKLWYLRFSLTPQASTMAVGSEDGRIFLFDVDTGTTFYQEIRHEKMTRVVRSVAFAPDENYLVAGCDDGVVWVFERLVDGKSKHQVPSDNDPAEIIDETLG